MEDQSFIPLGCFFCPCGAGACLLLTSRSKNNPNRQYYKCPEPLQCSHGEDGFFKWADKVRPEKIIDVNVPRCGGCDAGPCRVLREVDGRILFTCTVKEGQGACGYRVFQDELEKERLFWLEVECVCCDVDIRLMERQLEKNSRANQIDSKEWKEYMKLHQRRKTAKAAFARATGKSLA